MVSARYDRVTYLFAFLDRLVWLRVASQISPSLAYTWWVAAVVLKLMIGGSNRDNRTLTDHPGIVVNGSGAALDHGYLEAKVSWGELLVLT
jgi:hypothetical protein